MYKENILGYIGGFVVRKISKSLSCNICADALLEKKNPNAYYLNLTQQLKNNGGLIIPSEDVFKILKKCEIFLTAFITGRTENLQITRVRNVKAILSNKIYRDLPRNRFQSLSEHNYENEFITEDLHSTQITKKLSVVTWTYEFSDMVNIILKVC